jgi:O-antigen/teichoic acid export membrane protein
MIKFGLPTLPSNLSAVALQVADRQIMKIFISDAEIGIYQINAKLAIPMLLFFTVFDYAWKPFYLNNFQEKDAKKLFSRVLTYYILASSFILIFISFFIEYFVRIPIWSGRYLISPEYWGGIGIISIIMLGYLINGIITNFAAVFHIEKQTKYLSFAIGISALVSVIMNFILIPQIGSIGAAFSLLIGYFVGAIAMKFFQNKVSYKINYEWRRILIIAFLTALIFGIEKIFFSDFDLTFAFFVRIGLIILYLFFLKILGFFTSGEISEIKKLFRLKK